MSRDELKKALIKLKQNFSKIDKKNYLFIIPVVILILISSFQIAYFHFESSITNKIIDSMNGENITNETISLIREFINTYDNQFLSLGLEIIGIAISVWIGLNIYNIVKRDSIKELETVARKTQTELNEFSNNYKQFNITAIENAYLPEDRINSYFLDEFTKSNSDILDYKLTKYIVFFEKSFERIIDNYDNGNDGLMKKYLDKLKIEIDCFKSDIQLKYPKLEKNSKDLIDSYICCREGDYHYYCGLYYKFRNINPMSIDELRISQKSYSKIIEEYKINNKLVQTYVNNVQGYIYQLLQGMSENIDERKEYVKLAYDYSKNACIDENGKTIKNEYPRSYRNYGVNIENYLKYYDERYPFIEGMFEAYEQYKLAYEIDKMDIKTLTSLSSCVLKIFDYIIDISNDSSGIYKSISGVELDIINKKLDEIKIKYSLTELLDVAKKHLQIAMLVDNTNIAVHYHMIHVYMYLYLLNNKSSIFLNKGLLEIENCLALALLDEKETPIAFFYKARNFYYAIGDNENADIYHKKIEERKGQ